MERILLGLIILILFALLETAMLTSIGIFSGLIIRHKYFRVPVAIFSRGLLLVGAIFSLFATEFNHSLLMLQFEEAEVYGYWNDYNDAKFILETAEVGMLAFGDNGNLISAVIMRPYWRSDAAVGERAFLPIRMTFGSGLIGAISYLFFIWLALRLAQILAIRQKALPAEIFKR